MVAAAMALVRGDDKMDDAPPAGTSPLLLAAPAPDIEQKPRRAPAGADAAAVKRLNWGMAGPAAPAIEVRKLQLNTTRPLPRGVGCSAGWEKGGVGEVLLRMRLSDRDIPLLRLSSSAVSGEAGIATRSAVVDGGGWASLEARLLSSLGAVGICVIICRCSTV